MDIYVRGTRLYLDPTKMIGRGGEADIYDVGAGKVLKLFKDQNHSDLVGQPIEQEMAKNRIKEHQDKLVAFPKNLPDRVIRPIELVTNKTGNKILGYTMNFVKGGEVLYRFGERSFRQAGIPDEKVMRVFKDLHPTISKLHKQGIVIGDFNDLNVIIKDDVAWLIDVDSFQFAKFLCKVFTTKFVDPLLCNPQLNSLMLSNPHNENSDWYAFAVMLMQSLLFVGPYGGVHDPKDKGKRVSYDIRPLRRITVFDPEVRYPKPARHYGILPDDLLQYFYEVFKKDQREEFPNILLEKMRWTKCQKCGTDHARGVCPVCVQVNAAAITEVTTIRGGVTARRIFKTPGMIVFATAQGGRLYWLYHEKGGFYREDGRLVISGDINPKMRFRINGKKTIIAKDGQMIVIDELGVAERVAVDGYGLLPVIDANKQNRFWLNGGQLLRDGQIGQEYIGDVLLEQTLFWVGSKFGFGFYRAGELSVAFVFDTKRRGINDSVKLPPIKGQLIDSTCFFTDERCWFFVTTQVGGKTINGCVVIKVGGEIEAVAEAEAGDNSWLSAIRGKRAVGNFLFAATDYGLVRLEILNGQIIKTREFPDTEPFVDFSSNIFTGKDGIYVVGGKEIYLLNMK